MAQSYNFVDRLDLLPIGALTNSGFQTAFPSANSYSFSGTVGNRWSVVSQGAASNGRALRATYPANSFGQTAWAGAVMNSPGQSTHLEYDFFFESGFQFLQKGSGSNNPGGSQVGGGKTGCSISLGNPCYGTGSPSTTGTGLYWWWLADSTDWVNNTPKWTAILQRDTDGGQYLQNKKTPVSAGTTYHMHTQGYGGTSGIANYTITPSGGSPIVVAQFSGDLSAATSANGNHEYRIIAFAGGASIAYAPTVNCFTQMYNIHIYTNDQAGGNPPPPPVAAPLEYPAPAFDPSLGRIIAILRGANFNSVSDQELLAVGPPNKYILRAIYVTNASTSLTTAKGGFYTGTGKTGTTLVAATQAYTALTTSSSMLQLTLASGATATPLSGGIYFSLTTNQGATATADIYVLGYDLDF